MPELPEVETIVRPLKPSLVGRKIVKVTILRKRQWKDPDAAIRILKNSVAKDVSRRAKFIIIEFENGYRLIIHLQRVVSLASRSAVLAGQPWFRLP